MTSRYFRKLGTLGLFLLLALAACRQAPNEGVSANRAEPIRSMQPAPTVEPGQNIEPSITGSPEMMQVKIYFSSGDGTDCGEVRAVTRIVPRTQGVAMAALQELFKGPTEEEKKAGLSSFFSEETKDILDGVNVKNGSAYVDLDGSVLQKLGNATSSCGSRAFTASVEETLKQFPAVKKVFFAIESSPREYYDWIQVGECPPDLKNCDASNF